MTTVPTIRSHCAAFRPLKTILCACLMAAFVPAIAHAQVAPIGEKSMGDTSQTKLPDVLQKATIQQNLDRPLPLNAEFRDETNRTVHLGDYFGKRPAILALVYYKCNMLCPEEMNGLVGALDMLKFTPGKDFDVVVVSFDPSDTPAEAASEKALYVKRYGRPNTANGWHFLTGSQSSISALTTAVGFGYVSVPGPDGKINQFAHPSSIELITTEGTISQYYLGVEYSPRDMRAGLVEASHGEIGSPVDLIYTYCYHYDPHMAKNSMIVVRIVQLSCMLTVLALGAFILISLRQEAMQGGNAAVTKKANG